MRYLNRVLILAGFVALSSIESGVFQANAEAPDANQPASEKSTSSDAGSNQQPEANSNKGAGKSAGSGSASSSATSHTPSASKTTQPAKSTSNTSRASAGVDAQGKAFYVVTRDVVGRKVRGNSRKGEFIGRLSSFIIDTSNGETLYAVIDRGGFLGFEATHVVVPFQLVDFPGQWGYPILKVDESKLEGAPQISDRDVEALLHDPKWNRSVDDYYGIATSAHTTSSAKPGAAAASKTAKATSARSAAVAQGKKVANTICAACHTLNKGGGTLVGPNLYGVVGRPIASVAGYDYSSALKKHHGDWNQAKLEAWLKKPSAFAPGTKMTFAGFSSEKKRQDVIDYLKTLSDQAAAKH